MRIAIAAVGRLKDGPERALEVRYVDRAAKAGRAIGLTAVAVREHAESRAARPEDRKAEEGTALLASAGGGAVLVVLDEAGASLGSGAFAERLARWRDGGARDLVFAIGGPDGHGPVIRDRAALVLGLGPMTWPHQIVRVLIAEQIYRAVTILSGHPYHRA